MKTLFLLLTCLGAFGADTVIHPYQNLKITTHPMTSPRTINSWIAEVTLDATTTMKTMPAGGTWHTIKAFHDAYMLSNNAVLAVTGCFYNFVDSNTNGELTGFSAQLGSVVSPFDVQPPATISGQSFTDQSYAIVDNAPALNFDKANHASIVHRGIDGSHIAESVAIWTAVSGSFQSLSNGVDAVSLIDYSGHPNLTPGGGGPYGNGNRWYNVLTARTALAINQAGTKLYAVVVDNVSGSGGCTVPEMVNNILLDATLFPDPANRPYNAINTDGGGSTLMWYKNSSGAAVQVNNVTPRTDASILLVSFAPVGGIVGSGKITIKGKFTLAK